MLDKRAVAIVREQRAILGKRAAVWCTWKLLAPIATFAVIWIFYAWILEMPHAFHKAFAHGDLLLFSALIVMEASMEGSHYPAPTAVGRWMPQISILLAVTLFVAYGFLKYAAVVAEARLVNEVGAVAAHTITKLREFACVNCTVAIVAVGYSFRAFTTASDLEIADWMRRLGRE